MEQELAVSAHDAPEDLVTALLAADVRFHKRIIMATQNLRLGSILATLDDQMYRIRVLLPRSAGWIAEAEHEHRAVVARINDRDGDGAAQAMERHLRASCDRAIRLVLPIQR